MSITEVIKEHPVAIVLVTMGIALFVIVTRNGGGGGGLQFTGGGVASPPTDPGAVAMDEARVSAGQANIATIAQLALGQQQSSDALTANVTGTEAALQSNLASTSANLTATLAQTQAARDTALAEIAGRENIAGIEKDQAIAAANINAALQARIDETNRYIAKLQADSENARTQAQKDQARAADNTSIIGGIISFGEGLLATFF